MSEVRYIIRSAGFTGLVFCEDARFRLDSYMKEHGVRPWAFRSKPAAHSRAELLRGCIIREVVDGIEDVGGSTFDVPMTVPLDDERGGAP